MGLTALFVSVVIIALQVPVPIFQVRPFAFLRLFANFSWLNTALVYPLCIVTVRPWNRAIFMKRTNKDLPISFVFFSF